MKKISSRLAAASGVVLGGLLTALPVWAQISIVPDCATIKGPAPDLNCALITFGNIANLAFQIIGALVLLMFVYGGFKIIYSSGNGSKAKEGLNILRNAVIGMIIVLLAGYLVEYGLAQLKIVSVGSTCYIPGTDIQGKMREVKGVMRCVDNCKRLGAGYACRDIKSLSETGGCIQYLCPGADNLRCCPTSAPTIEKDDSDSPAEPTAETATDDES